MRLCDGYGTVGWNSAQLAFQWVISLELGCCDIIVGFFHETGSQCMVV